MRFILFSLTNKYELLSPVPSYIIGESEMETTKDGHNLSDFKYACVGYSVFLDKRDDPVGKPENQAELPFCAGIEVFLASMTFLTAFPFLDLSEVCIF